MNFTTVNNSHHMSSGSITKVMLKVLAALLPGIITMTYFFGWGVLSNILIAVPLALTAEASILLMRKRSLKPTLNDLSIVVTAVLLAIAIPAASPLWLITIGIIFATVFGKQLYGGLGFNPFNPAMIGYVVLLISFPIQMTQWPAAHGLNGTESIGLIDTIRYVINGSFPINIDTYTGATALDFTKTQLSQSLILSEFSNADVYGTLGAQTWEWVAIAYALGGITLIILRVMPWHAPVAMLASLFIIAEAFNIYDADNFPSGFFHLFSGNMMLGAFFIITDPVSSCTSNKGRLVFGALAGILVYVIRTWGGYPDGIAFSVLLANMCAPMIDYYSKPRVFGRKNKTKKYG